MELSDLTIDTFLILREAFFEEDGSPKYYQLRDKGNVQDDPLDVYISSILSNNLKGPSCVRSTGPLISPDMVIYRKEQCENALTGTLKNDTSRIVGIEVKKLERAKDGRIARSSGLDFNTTPPCGTIRIYDRLNKPLDIRGFYLFVCQERNEKDEYFLSALALCDGNVLNEDFGLYLMITQQREKRIGLGTYTDGVDRNRPMLIFSNPLGAKQLDHLTTLISENDLSQIDPRIKLVYNVFRNVPGREARHFYAFRSAKDVPPKWDVKDLLDPFPQPAKRVVTTQSRGKFKLPIVPPGEQ